MSLATLLVDDVTLVDLINDPTITRQAWSDAAACADLISDLASPYVPDDDGDAPPAEALERCGRCPVALHCLAAAMVFESGAPDELRFGWWGGLSPDERRDVAVRIDLPPVRINVDMEDLPPAERALRLRAEECSIPAIAAELGCTERTVYRYLARAAA